MNKNTVGDRCIVCGGGVANDDMRTTTTMHHMCFRVAAAQNRLGSRKNFAAPVDKKDDALRITAALAHSVKLTNITRGMYNAPATAGPGPEKKGGGGSVGARGNEFSEIETWAGFKGDDAVLPLVVTLMGPATAAGSEKKNAPRAGSLYPVVTQLENNAPAGDVRGSPTPMKQLCIELKNIPNESVLDILLRHKYTGADAIAMGVTANMVTTCANDWTIALIRRFFTPTQLYMLGLTFTPMLLRGMSLDIFAEAGYSHEDLHTLRFNVRAFRAAGGTNKQLGLIILRDSAQSINEEGILARFRAAAAAKQSEDGDDNGDSNENTFKYTFGA